MPSDENPFLDIPVHDLGVDAHRFHDHDGRRLLAIDLVRLGDPALQRSLIERTCQYIVQIREDWNDQLNASYLWRAVALSLHQTAPWQAAAFPALRKVSLTPISDAMLRRGSRLIAMLHELHKVGYQRLRISPRLTPEGAWRCAITSADNIAADGHSLIDAGTGCAPEYCSASGHSFFDWHDAAGLGARQLAELFLERFPEVAARGHGPDWTYAGWLTSVLGHSEAGRLPVPLAVDGDARFAVPPPPPPP